MSQLSAAEAAAKLGTDAKTLRRFLRQDATYMNAGSGGRYTFTTGDMPSLQSRFNAWAGRPRRVRNDLTMGDEAGLPWAVCKSKARKDIAAVRALSAARVDRLEAALMARGLHISQIDHAAV